MFERRLAEKINTDAPVSGLTAYAGSFPAPKATSPQVVGVISAGGAGSSHGRTQFELNCRFVVSGSALSSMSSAWNLYRYFFPPEHNGSKSFNANEYYVYAVLSEQGEPQPTGNNGNIFFASFVLKFLVARDT